MVSLSSRTSRVSGNSLRPIYTPDQFQDFLYNRCITIDEILSYSPGEQINFLYFPTNFFDTIPSGRIINFEQNSEYLNHGIYIRNNNSSLSGSVTTSQGHFDYFEFHILNNDPISWYPLNNDFVYIPDEQRNFYPGSRSSQLPGYTKLGFLGPILPVSLINTIPSLDLRYYDINDEDCFSDESNPDST